MRWRVSASRHEEVGTVQVSHRASVWLGSVEARDLQRVDENVGDYQRTNGGSHQCTMWKEWPAKRSITDSILGSFLTVPQPTRHTVFPWLPRPSIMDTQSQRQEWRDSALSSLNVAIEFLDLAKEISSITPAKAVFGSVSVLLAMIRVRFSSAMRCFVLTHNQDSMANELDYVELGLSCADICRALDRGMNGRRLDEFSQSVRDAMGQLTA